MNQFYFLQNATGYMTQKCSSRYIKKLFAVALLLSSILDSQKSLLS